MKMIKIGFVLLVVVSSFCFCSGGGNNNYWALDNAEGLVYEPHDPVSIVVNKVVPFNNPSETYRYYSLPFCQQHDSTILHHDEEKKEAVVVVDNELEKDFDLQDQQERKATQVKQEDDDNDALILRSASSRSAPLGQQLVGDRREISPYQVSFLDNVKWKLLCNRTLSPDDLKKFKSAIWKDYFFEMFVQDLPMWGYVGAIIEEDFIIGEMDSSKTLLFPHLHFRFGYNENEHKIVSAKVTTDMDRRVDITNNVDQAMEVSFSYSVEWFQDNELTWEKRMTRYTDFSRAASSSSLEIHWLSILNSFILVLIFAAFLTKIVVRDLKSNFSTITDGVVKEEERKEEEKEEEEVSGWKAIHGDVFRFPEYSALLCACVGIGNQFLVITMCHLCLALSGIISSTRHGSLVSALVVLYCFAGILSGYTSIRLYLQMNGTNNNWYQCLLITIGLFPTPTAIVFLCLNSLALAKGSTIALPFEAFCHVVFLFLFLAVPLTVLGGMLAKNFCSTDFHAPTRTTEQPREIPQNNEQPWYKSKPFLLLVIAGFVPFSSIYREFYYVLVSMWGYQIYTLFGILFISFVLLVILTSFTSVALLYFQLVREDHHWWWTSFVSGGMTGVVMYLYSIYYFFYDTGMTGLLQSLFYFGYMLIVSFACFLMLGSAGFQCSLAFVKYIYSRSRCD